MESIRANRIERQTKGKSVLVVDDDADIREAFVSLLRHEGYVVTSCANGRDALERLKEGPAADVLVLDLMMPVMDGWQFRVEQKRDPAIAKIPVIAVTADRSSKAAAVDADAYLTKPVDATALIATLDRLLLAREREAERAHLIETDRLASLGTLAAGVAHEINNPLAYVMANVDLVARELHAAGLVEMLPRGTRKPATGLSPSNLSLALSHAREGLERIRTIVQDLKTFSRPVDDRQSRIDVRTILDSCVNMVANEVLLRARIHKEYGDVPLLVGSEARLAQALLNLIVNAIQAVPEGHPERNEVRIVVKTGPSGEVVVEIHDTGEGIPPEVLGHVFEPFFTTKPALGTGLGLSICHGIVTGMGGRLTVESQLGQGSVFRVELPAAQGSVVEATPLPQPSAGGRRGKVLVVDDEPLLCASFERVIGSEHQVTAVQRAADARALIAGGARFDVIVCDLMMPEMSGMELYAELERIAPDQAARTVFLTGGAFTPRARAFAASVPNKVLDKPIGVDALLAMLRERIG